MAHLRRCSKPACSNTSVLHVSNHCWVLDYSEMLADLAIQTQCQTIYIRPQKWISTAVFKSCPVELHTPFHAYCDQSHMTKFSQFSIFPFQISLVLSFLLFFSISVILEEDCLMVFKGNASLLPPGVIAHFFLHKLHLLSIFFFLISTSFISLITSQTASPEEKIFLALHRLQVSIIFPLYLHH